MTTPRFEVLTIGNAIVDVIADADDAFLERQGLDKASMRLIDEDEAVRLYGVMGPGREISGGRPRQVRASGIHPVRLARMGCQCGEPECARSNAGARRCRPAGRGNR